MKIYLDARTLVILSDPGTVRDRWADWLGENLKQEARLFASVLGLLEVERAFASAGRAPEHLREFLGDLDRLLETVLPLQRREMHRALDLAAAHDLPWPVAVEGAVALSNEIEIIASPEERFAVIPGLRHEHP